MKAKPNIFFLRIILLSLTCYMLVATTGCFQHLCLPSNNKITLSNSNHKAERQHIFAKFCLPAEIIGEVLTVENENSENDLKIEKYVKSTLTDFFNLQSSWILTFLSLLHSLQFPDSNLFTAYQALPLYVLQCSWKHHLSYNL